jgi:hypothetical protein
MVFQNGRMGVRLVSRHGDLVVGEEHYRRRSARRKRKGLFSTGWATHVA